jgi:hypothetical protein
MENGEGLAMMGPRNYYDVCSVCGHRCYGGFIDGKCSNCGGATTRIELEEGERVAGNVCDKCKEEIETLRKIVEEEGGVYFHCKDCGCEGAAGLDVEWAQIVREHDGSMEKIDGKYKPLLVHIDKNDCPGCGEDPQMN